MSQTLLAPVPFDTSTRISSARRSMPPGGTDRYVGEQAQYNALYAELAVWLRQKLPAPQPVRSGAGKEGK